MNIGDKIIILDNNHELEYTKVKSFQGDFVITESNKKVFQLFVYRDPEDLDRLIQYLQYFANRYKVLAVRVADSGYTRNLEEMK